MHFSARTVILIWFHKTVLDGSAILLKMESISKKMINLLAKFAILRSQQISLLAIQGKIKALTINISKMSTLGEISSETNIWKTALPPRWETKWISFKRLIYFALRQLTIFSRLNNLLQRNYRPLIDKPMTFIAAPPLRSADNLLSLHKEVDTELVIENLILYPRRWLFLRTPLYNRNNR